MKNHPNVLCVMRKSTVRTPLIAALQLKPPHTKNMQISVFYSIFKLKFHQKKSGVRTVFKRKEDQALVVKSMHFTNIVLLQNINFCTTQFNRFVGFYQQLEHENDFHRELSGWLRLPKSGAQRSGSESETEAVE